MLKRCDHFLKRFSCGRKIYCLAKRTWIIRISKNVAWESSLTKTKDKYNKTIFLIQILVQKYLLVLWRRSNIKPNTRTQFTQFFYYKVCPGSNWNKFGLIIIFLALCMIVVFLKRGGIEATVLTVIKKTIRLVFMILARFDPFHQTSHGTCIFCIVLMSVFTNTNQYFSNILDSRT
jgi:hypothetical protein